MTSIESGMRFIRTGSWLVLLGMVMSFGMVMHYVVGSQYDNTDQFLKNVSVWFACPWTLSTAVVIGGAFGMMAIGVIQAFLGKHAPAPTTSATDTARRLCAFALIAMFLTGYVGYFAVDAVWPTFYYSPVRQGKNFWLFMQLACMVLYTSGAFMAFGPIRHASRALA
jgi:hypothetical protein